MKDFFFGKLTLDAIPHIWYTIGGTVFIIIMALRSQRISLKLSAGVGFGMSGLLPLIPKRSGLCT